MIDSERNPSGIWPGERVLYISDMDGTLLDSRSRVSDRSARMLNELMRAGVMFTVATARTPATVQPLMGAVRQSFYTAPSGEKLPIPAIVMTGAAFWDRHDVRFRSIELIPRDDAEIISDAFARQGIHPFVYCLSGDSFLNVYHPAAMTRREDAFYQERRHLALKRFHLDQKPASLDKVAIFFAIGPVDGIKAVCESLREATPCAAAWYPDIFMPDTGLVDLYAPGVSKARAVTEMKRLTGADRTVVFGDNLNDLPMMRVADLAVAMSNALPEVRQQADIVIGSNDSDAVARFIMERHLPGHPLLTCG
ncbi:MAG: HAD family hydrolase [Muribaculaceae bacterium]|nr:HAD family hydrolase [Muribaculaceae bacterium]